MNRDEAEAFAAFVNHGNERYRAEALPMGERETWVVLADNESTDGVHPPPVIDPDAYLDDLRTSDRLPTECQLLLAAWLARRADGLDHVPIIERGETQAGLWQQSGVAAAETEDGTALSLRLELPTDPKHVTALRRAACSLLESVGATGRSVGDVETLVGELATNAVLHAGTDRYCVQIDVRADRVLVVVSDCGRGFPGASHLPAPGVARTEGASAIGDATRFGGWGLPLVYSLADRVEVFPTLPEAPHGTTVRAEMRFAADPAAFTTATAAATG